MSKKVSLLLEKLFWHKACLMSKKVSLLLEKLFCHKGSRTAEGSRLGIDCRRQGGRKYNVLAAGLTVDGGWGNYCPNHLKLGLLDSSHC